MKKLGEAGSWKPAMVELENTIDRLAGKRLPRLMSGSLVRRRGKSEERGTAEAFFCDDGILYAINSPYSAVDTAYSMLRYEDDGILNRVNFSKEQDGVVLGAVTHDPERAAELLDEFRSAFEAAVTASLDGRRTRHMQFEWLRASARGPLGGLRDRFESEESGVKFSEPSMSESEQSGSELLANGKVRTLLREICEASFAREADILSHRGVKKDEIESSLSSLKEASLVVSEYLLQCRKTSASLTRISSPGDLQTFPAADFRCASCSRKFSEELLTEGYAPSELGKTLIRGSHWMTIFVTSRLMRLGVEREAILWNIEQAGDEVDVIAGFMDRLWIFELKDRDFGSGDAHPFNYRKVRYNADEAIVVTSGKVMADARKVFEELAAGSRRARARNITPLFIEGLGQVLPTLQAEFERVSNERAKEMLAIPSVITGFDLRVAVVPPTDV